MYANLSLLLKVSVTAAVKDRYKAITSLQGIKKDQRGFSGLNSLVH